MSKRYEIKFYIGTEKDYLGGHISDLEGKIEKAGELLIENFEAFTSYTHFGGWGTPTVLEEGITFVVVIPVDSELYLVQYVGVRLRELFDQTTVLVTRAEVDAEFI